MAHIPENHDQEARKGPIVVPSGIEKREKGFDLIRYFHLCLEKKWLILRVAALVAGLGGYMVYQVPDQYRAMATFQVNQKEANIVSIKDAAIQNNIGSREVVQTIVAKMGQLKIYENMILDGSLEGFDGFQLTSAPTEPELRSQWVAGRAGALVGKVGAQLRTGTRLVDVAVEDEDPLLAKALADAVIDQVIKLNLAEKMAANRSANTLLLEQSSEFKAKVSESEKKLLEYQEQTNAGNLIERHTLLEQNLSSLNGQYSKDQARRIEVESDLEKIKTYDGDYTRIGELSSVRSDTDVTTLIVKLTQQQALVNAYTNRYKPLYPKMIRANEELRDLKEGLNAAFAQSVERLKIERERLIANEERLTAAIREAESELLSLDGLLIQYNELRREVESDKAVYDSILTRLKETDFTKGLDSNAIIPVQGAQAPSSPFKPKRTIAIIQFVVIGLGLGIGLVFFIDFLDQSVKTVDDAENHFGLPVIGAIPMDKSVAKKKNVSADPGMHDDPKSTTVEAFRTAIASIKMLKAKDDHQVVMVTSALPSEGKTYNAYNLAINFAKLGFKTVLVDMDLRKPSVQKMHADFAGVEGGVSDLLLGREKIENVVHPGFHQNLSLIFSGERLTNPVEQLTDRAKLVEFFRDLSRRYDRIVIDTAPVNAVADTLYLQSFSDVLCFVVRSHKTSKKVVERGLQSLERAGGRVSGLVLNVLPQRSGYGYYYYYYYNHYGPDGAYGETPEKPKKDRNGKRSRKA